MNRALFLSLLMAFPVWAAAAEKGYFGVRPSVEVDGFFFNPIVQSATIQALTPQSPAAKSSMAVGDQFIEVGGQKVAGSEASALKALLSKPVGESLRFVLKKPDGTVYSVVLVAAPRP
jgi:membrane-associated protease RseP (regulator of RpoE activity)